MEVRWCEWLADGTAARVAGEPGGGPAAPAGVMCWQPRRRPRPPFDLSGLVLSAPLIDGPPGAVKIRWNKNEESVPSHQAAV